MDENRGPGKLRRAQEMKKNEPNYGLTPLLVILMTVACGCEFPIR
jgi:hypothetical protein